MIENSLKHPPRRQTDLTMTSWRWPTSGHAWVTRGMLTLVLSLCMSAGTQAAEAASEQVIAPAPQWPLSTDTAPLAGASSAAPSIPAPPSPADASTPVQPSPPNSQATLHQTTGSAWQRLSPRQKQALTPLATEWHELTLQQQLKWLNLAKNFDHLSDEEQLTLHGRMREWAALSPRQRSQARFHFSSTQSLPIEDKRAQWAAYKALSEQEKRKLSSGPKAPIKSAARSIAPASSRLVRPPLLPVNATPAVLRVAPARPIHPKTLLPRPS